MDLNSYFINVSFQISTNAHDVVCCHDVVTFKVYAFFNLQLSQSSLFTFILSMIVPITDCGAAAITGYWVYPK